MTTIILGMHRSGTSVLGNILCEMGWSIGRSPMLAADENPLGFFENRMLMRLHDEMLFEANSTWSDPHPIPADHWTPARTEVWAARIRELLGTEFEENEQPLIKDPRMCRLLPPWRSALARDWQQILFFLPVRHPLEVAASLRARDGMSLEYGILLWLTHFFEAEIQTRDTRRLFLLQDRLISGLENQRIADFSGTSLSDVEAAHHAAVRPGLRHHHAENPEILPGSLLGDLAAELWQNVLTLASGVGKPDQIDRLRDRYHNFLGLIPREFRGTASTGSPLPSGGITTFLEPIDTATAEAPRQRAFIERAGAFFTVRFPSQLGDIRPLRWRAILPAPCEIEIHRVLLGSSEIEAKPSNAFDEKDGTFRFFEGEAAFLLDMPEVSSSPPPLGEVIEISGSIRLIPPNELGREFVEQARARPVEIPPAAEPLVETEVPESPQTSEVPPPCETPEPPTEASSTIAEAYDHRFEALIISHGAPTRLRHGDSGNSRTRVIPRSLHAFPGYRGHDKPSRHTHSNDDPSHLILRETISARRELRDFVRQQSKRTALRRHPLSLLAALLPQLFFVRTGLRLSRRLVLDSGLFDPRHYRGQCLPDLQVLDPAVHYLVIGWKLGLSPSPLIRPERLKPLSGGAPLVVYLSQASAAKLSPNLAFDPEFYLRKYPIAAESGEHPLVHFVKHGASCGFDPCPLFSTTWYAATYAERIPPGRNPLHHYLAEGAFNGCDPHPLFNTDWYLTKAPEAGSGGNSPLEHFLQHGTSTGPSPSPLFDSSFYANSNPSENTEGANLLIHYLTVGNKQGLKPNPLFDPAWYLNQYPEVAQAGIDPLFHYASGAWRQGFKPHPLFDPQHYLIRMPAGQVPSEPLAHYLATGSDGKLQPHPLFDPAWYFSRYPAVAEAGMNPLCHFVLSGADENLNPHPLFNTGFYRRSYLHSTAEPRNPLSDYLDKAGSRNPSPLFDTAYYLARNPGVAASGINPLVHFLSNGAAEGRDPSPFFSVSWYVSRYGHLIPQGQNPLVHYLTAGELLGCLPNPLFDPVWYASIAPGAASAGSSLLEHFIENGAAAGLRPCPLFDCAWYLARYPEVAASGINPLAHFINNGAFEGFNPSPLFDSGWYLNTYPGVAAAAINPLAHYLNSGAADGNNPNPLFDSNWYRNSYPEVDTSGLTPLEHYLLFGAAKGFRPNPFFEPHWYRIRNLEVSAASVEPLAHYLECGAARRLSPHPLFDPDWYLETYPDVAAARIEPLAHYLASGAREGFAPHPLFDPGFYQHQHPEAIASGMPALLHFMTIGATKGYDPCRAFSNSWYLARNPDVAAAGLNPVVHYLCQDADVSPDPHPLFDTRFYLGQCPELAGSRIPPLVHYLRTGASAGLNPHPLFNSSWYLETYPEVAEAKLNPLVHYLSSGAFERRGTSPLFDGEFYFEALAGLDISQTTPLAHFIETGGALGLSPCRMFDSAAYLDAYPEVADAGVNPLLHYLASGEREGRTVPGKFDPVFYAKQLEHPVTGQSLLEHYIREGSRNGLLPAPVSVLFNLTIPSLLRLPECPNPVASIVIPVHNQFQFTISCLAAIAAAQTSTAFEVIVVDDCSSDETATLPYRVLNLSYIHNETNLGFGGTCNRGAAAARGEFIVFLNNDTRVHDGWLDALVAAAAIPGVGYVGAKLIYPNGRLQEAGGIVWNDGSAWNYGNGDDPDKPEYNYLRKADYCSAAAALVPAALFSELGGFSPEFARAYYEDTDLCMRIRAAGHDVIYQPLAAVTHFEGGTCGTSVNSGVKQQQVINQQVFLEKWKESLAAHPANGDLHGHFNHLYPAGTILFIDDLIPFPKISSGGQRAWNIIVVLLELGYHVTFLPSCGCEFPVEEQRDALRNLGVQVLEPPASAWVAGDHSHFELKSYDKVILARHYIAASLYQEIRSRMPGAVVIFDTVDLHYQRLRREAAITHDPTAAEKAEIAYAEETDLLRDCEQTWVVSEIERTELLSINPQADVRVVSNIVDVPGTKIGWDCRAGILFIGGFNHPPNQDAVIWFIREVLPTVLREIPDLVFHILGSNMPEEFHCLASPNINPVGFVDDPGEWFEQVRLSVAPLRYGAGVKGKVNQSLSYGVPVVGTGIAFEGMGIPSGSCVLAADDPASMAQHVIHLYKTRDLWESCSAEGIRLMHEMYSLEFAGRSIAGALSELRKPVQTEISEDPHT